MSLCPSIIQETFPSRELTNLSTYNWFCADGRILWVYILEAKDWFMYTNLSATSFRVGDLPSTRREL